MSNRLADRLSAARRLRFVGRSHELEILQDALSAAELPFQVLYVFGPGGMGKTTLLKAFHDVCDQAGVPFIHVDARNVEPSPETFVGALRAALGLAPDGPPLPAAFAQARRSTLVIDTYETLAPLDNWLRDAFLPQLPANTLVVLAGRTPPAPAWHTDAGWQTLIRTLPLRNFSPDESRAYLGRRNVPAGQHGAVLAFTHGHPLALSLVADVLDQRPGQTFQPEAAPDVVKTLLEQFVQKVPGPAHRAALEACAMVRLTTETLLAEMLAMPDAHELFDWLRGLSFIEAGPQGLFPHDLAREALVADVHWRNPDWYAELHRRARFYYTARLQQARGAEQQRLLFDLIFLHRDNPAVRPFFEWQEGGQLLTDGLRPGDLPELTAMVARHEGEASTQIADAWLARQPEGVLVLREAGGKPVGFVTMVGLQAEPAETLGQDPGAKAAWDYVQRRAPLRPGEVATLFRFWMGRDTYQAVSPVQSLIFVNMVRHYLTAPGLAFTLLPCADPDFWAGVFAYADLARLAEADFAVGGRRYGMYGHDWRAVPPAVWLNRMAEQETGVAPAAAPARPDPLIVLSESEFAEAVREALRDFDRPDLLHGNPLLRSRLVAERAGAGADETGRLAVLMKLLQEAAEALQRSARDAKLYRALNHTYLQPAPTQEQAAELLDLPFSTFRRHLKSGLSRVTEILWQMELGGSER